jgi:hypothetical protein
VGSLKLTLNASHPGNLLPHHPDSKVKKNGEKWIEEKNISKVMKLLKQSSEERC